MRQRALTRACVLPSRGRRSPLLECWPPMTSRPWRLVGRSPIVTGSFWRFPQSWPNSPRKLWWVPNSRNSKLCLTITCMGMQSITDLVLSLECYLRTQIALTLHYCRPQHWEIETSWESCSLALIWLLWLPRRTWGTTELFRMSYLWPGCEDLALLQTVLPVFWKSDRWRVIYAVCFFTVVC